MSKTNMVRVYIAQTLKLTGPSLMQMFIDELDAIGTKRLYSEKSSDREVQRTMLELLNQFDERIKCVALSQLFPFLGS